MLPNVEVLETLRIFKKLQILIGALHFFDFLKHKAPRTGFLELHTNVRLIIAEKRQLEKFFPLQSKLIQCLFLM